MACCYWLTAVSGCLALGYSSSPSNGETADAAPQDSGLRPEGGDGGGLDSGSPKEDQCPDDDAKLGPGVCGCGTADDDADSDGVLGCHDAAPYDPLVCSDTDNDGCDDCSLGTYDPRNDGMDRDGDGICDLDIPVEAVQVLPLYPKNGANWLDYVANDDPDSDRFHQDDGGGAACVATQPATYLNNCVHGGEYRKVVATGASGCQGLQLTESLGLFHWQCQQELDGSVVFYSHGLRAGKGIGNSIDYSGTTLAFLPNQVTISGTAYRAASRPEVWWSNTLRDVIVDGPTGDTPNVLTRAGVNDLFVVKDNVTTDGYNLNDDRMALVVRPGKKLSFSGAMNTDDDRGPSAVGPRAIAVVMGGQEILWIEGHYGIPSGVGGINSFRSHMIRIHELWVDGAGLDSQGDVGLTVAQGSSTHVTGYRGQGGFRCAQFAADYLSVDGMVCSGHWAGVMFWGGSECGCHRHGRHGQRSRRYFREGELGSGPGPRAFREHLSRF